VWCVCGSKMCGSLWVKAACTVGQRRRTAAVRDASNAAVSRERAYGKGRHARHAQKACCSVCRGNTGKVRRRPAMCTGSVANEPSGRVVVTMYAVVNRQVRQRVYKMAYVCGTACVLPAEMEGSTRRWRKAGRQVGRNQAGRWYARQAFNSPRRASATGNARLRCLYSAGRASAGAEGSRSGRQPVYGGTCV